MTKTHTSKTLKALQLGAAVAIATSLFSACTVEVKENTETTATTGAPPVTAAPSDADLFVEYLESEYPGVSSMFGGSTQLVVLGRTMCDAIDEGMTIDELALIIMESGSDMQMVATILATAIYYFCPENEWYVNQTGV
jgi:hypothetical protein